MESQPTSTEPNAILVSLARQTAGKTPTMLLFDGAANPHDTCLKEFCKSRLNTRTEHIRLQGHYNKMERMNGEIRDRERVMRTLEKADSPILEGYEIFHNYIRPHMALEYKTPSEMAGIQVRGKDKWMTLIQNAKSRSV